ncbi:MAG TPA: D-2-hydroxyacid dehydrogenase [Pyrinomonadaceae bacterium]|jgi:glycerate dehydrogenase|nr:D-2-hydroxyacid dehydrogenase [Pyrinomonadaceae bacterium]
MQHIVFLERNTLRAEIRPPAFAHEWRDYGETRPDEIVERLKGASIAVVNKVRIGEAELRQLPALKLIAVAATGTDNLDLKSCRERGISVSNVRGYATHTLPEHVLMLILALRRNLASYVRDVRAGEWQRAEQFCLLTHPIRDLNDSTLGIIGYGALGRSMERLARAVGMHTLVAEHKGAGVVRAGRTPFAEVLHASDIVTLHTPLNDETRNLIGAAELAMMRREAVLINCARGGVVDELALVEALRAGVIAGAGVDVLSREPPPEGGNALVELDLPNLIVTPHIAWASLQAMQTLADQLIDNIEAFVRGEGRNLVTG